MILYDQKIQAGMFAYGIEIPLFDSRMTKTFEVLSNDFELGPKINQWHIPSIHNIFTKEDLLRVHTPRYVERLFSDKVTNEILKTYELIDDEGNFYRYDPVNTEKPLSQLFQSVLKNASGTFECCSIALEKGWCFYFGGGMHHAQADYGSGFCLINDIVIALSKLEFLKRIENAWVIDVDAHKGDGTAAITKGNDFFRTLSIHMKDGWPLDQQDRDENDNPNLSFVPSDVDIPIASDENHLYIQKLEEGLKKLESFGIPDIAIIVLGADPYEEDELDSTKALKLSLSDLMKRDILIHQFLKKNHIPEAYLMSGGYGKNTHKVYTQFTKHLLKEVYGAKEGFESESCR